MWEFTEGLDRSMASQLAISGPLQDLTSTQLYRARVLKICCCSPVQVLFVKNVGNPTEISTLMIPENQFRFSLMWS